MENTEITLENISAQSEDTGSENASSENGQEKSLLDIIIKAVSEKKAREIVVYDTLEKSPFMDFMVVATSDNIRMNDAIAQNIKDRLQENGYTGDYKVEGTKESRWILVDLKDIVVHLFVADERDLYQIDRLYEECPRTRYE